MADIQFINRVHSIVYDECHPLILEEAQQMSKNISKYCTMYFLRMIYDNNFQTLEQVRNISEYLLQLHDWPFDNFEAYSKLIEKFSIHIEKEEIY